MLLQQISVFMLPCGQWPHRSLRGGWGMWTDLVCQLPVHHQLPWEWRCSPWICIQQALFFFWNLFLSKRLIAKEKKCITKHWDTGCRFISPVWWQSHHSKSLQTTHYVIYAGPPSFQFTHTFHVDVTKFPLCGIYAANRWPGHFMPRSGCSRSNGKTMSQPAGKSRGHQGSNLKCICQYHSKPEKLNHPTRLVSEYISSPSTRHSSLEKEASISYVLKEWLNHTVS